MIWRGAEDQSHGGCHQRSGGDPPWEIDGGQPLPMPMLESRAFRMPRHPGEEVGVRRMQQIPDVVVQPAQERGRPPICLLSATDEAVPYRDQERAQKTPFCDAHHIFCVRHVINTRQRDLRSRRTTPNEENYHCSVPDASTSREPEITRLTWSSVYTANLRTNAAT